VYPRDSPAPLRCGCTRLAAPQQGLALNPPDSLRPGPYPEGDPEALELTGLHNHCCRSQRSEILSFLLWG